MRRWRLSEFSMGYFGYVRCFGIFALVPYCPGIESYYYNFVEKTMADWGFFFGKIIASAAVSANTIVHCSTVIVVGPAPKLAQIKSSSTGISKEI